MIVTDRLCSDAAALPELLPDVVHRQSKFLTNGAENSRQATRRRERAMQRFSSPEQTQRFLEPWQPHSSPAASPLRRILSSCDGGVLPNVADVAKTATSAVP